MTRVACILSYRFLPADSGGRKAIALFYRYFSRHAQLTCFTTRNNGTDEQALYQQVKLFKASPARYLNPVYFFRIRQWIRKHKVTHLLLDHPYYGWLAVALQKATGVKLVIRSHNIEGQRFKNLGKPWWALLATYEKWVHRQADYNFFITEEDGIYAITHFKLKRERCATITYGINWPQPPTASEKATAAAILRQQYGIETTEHIFLFNGIFSYQPNAAALALLVNHIYPELLRSGIAFRLIICGKHIPETINTATYSQIITAGYVPDISVYLRGATLFLNPITDGGGIKTKLVEALASNTTCVSFVNGAIGIPPILTGNKLHIAETDDAATFTAATLRALAAVDDEIPAVFFTHFNWDHIATKAVDFINS
jgi:glycosyltransferase involved in cell wall biosynthesis